MSRYDPLPLTFSHDEMRKYLTLWGYAFATRKETFYRNVYHNDVEAYEQDVEVVLKDGEECPSNTHDRESDRVVETVFSMVLKVRLLNLLTT